MLGEEKEPELPTEVQLKLLQKMYAATLISMYAGIQRAAGDEGVKMFARIFRDGVKASIEAMGILKKGVDGFLTMGRTERALGFEIQTVKKSDTTIYFRITHCPFLEMITGMGAESYCDEVSPIALEETRKYFLPKWELEVKKRLIDGEDCCEYILTKQTLSREK